MLNWQKEAVAQHCELSAHDGLAVRLELLETTQVGPRRTSLAQNRYKWKAELAKKEADAAAAQKQGLQGKPKQKQFQIPTRPDDLAQRMVLQEDYQRHVEGWLKQQQKKQEQEDMQQQQMTQEQKEQRRELIADIFQPSSEAVQAAQTASEGTDSLEASKAFDDKVEEQLMDQVKNTKRSLKLLAHSLRLP